MIFDVAITFNDSTVWLCSLHTTHSNIIDTLNDKDNLFLTVYRGEQTYYINKDRINTIRDRGEFE